MSQSQQASATAADPQPVARSGPGNAGNGRGPQQSARSSASAPAKQGCVIYFHRIVSSHRRLTLAPVLTLTLYAYLQFPTRSRTKTKRPCAAKGKWLGR